MEGLYTIIMAEQNTISKMTSTLQEKEIRVTYDSLIIICSLILHIGF